MNLLVHQPPQPPPRILRFALDLGGALDEGVRRGSQVHAGTRLTPPDAASSPTGRLLAPGQQDYWTGP